MSRNLIYEKLHPQGFRLEHQPNGDGVFGHGESGMAHGKEHNQCPMPNAPSGGARTLRTQKGIEFPAAFNKGFCALILPEYTVLWLAGESN